MLSLIHKTTAVLPELDRPVHGALLELSAAEWRELERAEGGYALREVVAAPYGAQQDERVVALAFVSRPLMALERSDLPPPRAYLGRIAAGAAEVGLAPEWQEALRALEDGAIEGALPDAYRRSPSEALPAALAAAAVAAAAAAVVTGGGPS